MTLTPWLVPYRRHEPGYTGASHVYGGDFFSTARSEFDPDTLAERPYDVERTLALFEDAT